MKIILLRMLAHFAQKAGFCYSHFTKLKFLNNFLQKICIYQKKAVPLHRDLKKLIKTIKHTRD